MPTWALRAAVTRSEDWLWTGQWWTSMRQTLYIAVLRNGRPMNTSWGWCEVAPPLMHLPPLMWLLWSHTHQTATQATLISGMWEVRSVGVLFPTKGTA